MPPCIAGQLLELRAGALRAGTMEAPLLSRRSIIGAANRVPVCDLIGFKAALTLVLPTEFQYVHDSVGPKTGG